MLQTTCQRPVYRPIYRCYNGSIDAKECDGQTVYSAKKIEGAVLEVVRGYFDAIQSSVDAVWKEQARRRMRSLQKDKSLEEQRKLAKLRKQNQALRDEILKSLTGEARFDEDILQSLLEDNHRAIEVSEGIIAAC